VQLSIKFQTLEGVYRRRISLFHGNAGTNVCGLVAVTTSASPEILPKRHTSVPHQQLSRITLGKLTLQVDVPRRDSAAVCRVRLGAGSIESIVSQYRRLPAA
jgi:hypothetical protein